jgi:23S rRNA pseudouridine1911/1915/1917 synthase
VTNRRYVEHIVTAAEAGQTVQDILTGPLQISKRMIQKLTRSKGIFLNRRPAYLAKQVQAGDVVRAAISFQEQTGLTPVNMELEILYEDADLLIVNKPPFLLVHPLHPTQTNTLSHGIAYHFQQQGLSAKVRPVHRIDRDTSGLLVVAKTAYAHQHLDRQLRERNLHREYLAFVSGVIPEASGTIDAPIGKHKQHPNLRAVRPNSGEFALTRYEVVETYAHATLVRLKLETGRTHQIRVHMAHIGHPLIGDRQYGQVGTRLLKRQALHASRLSFQHPTTGEALTFEAPLPEDLLTLHTKLKEGIVP